MDINVKRHRLVCYSIARKMETKDPTILLKICTFLPLIKQLERSPTIYLNYIIFHKPIRTDLKRIEEMKKLSH